MGTEIKSEDRGAARHRRRLTTAIKESLRELSIQLSLLNHHVSGRLELNDVDLDCLDLISRHGPLSPSALARRAGLHPATITGILDRLERGGWVARDRDQADRRAVRVRALRPIIVADVPAVVIHFAARADGADAKSDCRAAPDCSRDRLIGNYRKQVARRFEGPTDHKISGGRPKAVDGNLIRVTVEYVETVSAGVKASAILVARC